MKNAIVDIGTITSKPPVMSSLWGCTVYGSSPIAFKLYLSVDCRASQEKKHINDPGGYGAHGELQRLFRELITDRRALSVRANMMRGSTEDMQVYEAFSDATSPGI